MDSSFFSSLNQSVFTSVLDELADEPGFFSKSGSTFHHEGYQAAVPGQHEEASASPRRGGHTFLTQLNAVHAHASDDEVAPPTAFLERSMKATHYDPEVGPPFEVRAGVKIAAIKELIQVPPLHGPSQFKSFLGDDLIPVVTALFWYTFVLSFQLRDLKKQDRYNHPLTMALAEEAGTELHVMLAEMQLRLAGYSGFFLRYIPYALAEIVVALFPYTFSYDARKQARFGAPFRNATYRLICNLVNSIEVHPTLIASMQQQLFPEDVLEGPKTTVRPHTTPGRRRARPSSSVRSTPSRRPSTVHGGRLARTRSQLNNKILPSPSSRPNSSGSPSSARARKGSPLVDKKSLQSQGFPLVDIDAPAGQPIRATTPSSPVRGHSRSHSAVAKQSKAPVSHRRSLSVASKAAAQAFRHHQVDARSPEIRVEATPDLTMSSPAEAPRKGSIGGMSDSTRSGPLRGSVNDEVSDGSSVVNGEQSVSFADLKIDYGGMKRQMRSMIEFAQSAAASALPGFDDIQDTQPDPFSDILHSVEVDSSKAIRQRSLDITSVSTDIPPADFIVPRHRLGFVDTAAPADRTQYAPLNAYELTPCVKRNVMSLEGPFHVSKRHVNLPRTVEVDTTAAMRPDKYRRIYATMSMGHTEVKDKYRVARKSAAREIAAMDNWYEEEARREDAVTDLFLEKDSAKRQIAITNYIHSSILSNAQPVEDLLNNTTRDLADAIVSWHREEEEKKTEEIARVAEKSLVEARLKVDEAEKEAAGAVTYDAIAAEMAAEAARVAIKKRDRVVFTASGTPFKERRFSRFLSRTVDPLQVAGMRDDDEFHSRVFDRMEQTATLFSDVLTEETDRVYEIGDHLGSAQFGAEVGVSTRRPAKRWPAIHGTTEGPKPEADPAAEDAEDAKPQRMDASELALAARRVEADRHRLEFVEPTLAVTPEDIKNLDSDRLELKRKRTAKQKSAAAQENH